MQTKALVRVTDSGGTYTAVAKIGTCKSTRASCTMSAERAAQRAAAKSFGCMEAGTTYAAASEHLRELVRRKLIVMTTERESRGRPTKLFGPTQAALELLNLPESEVAA